MALIGWALAAKKSAVRGKITAGRMSFPTELKGGSFDGEPFFWKPSEAWARSGGKWSEVNVADVGVNGRAMLPEAFDRRFGKLPLQLSKASSLTSPAAMPARA
jgi:hypothetical protein